MPSPPSLLPQTPSALLAHYRSLSLSLSPHSSALPLHFPGLGPLLVITYLSIPHTHRPWLKRARYLVFLLNAYLAAYQVLYLRAMNPASAVGSGLTAAWSVIWAFRVLVAGDCQDGEFARIEVVRVGRREMSERREGVKRGEQGKALEGAKEGYRSSKETGSHKAKGISNRSRNRKIWEDSPTTGTARNGKALKSVDSSGIDDKHPDPDLYPYPYPQASEAYFWQPYPSTSPLPSRLDWLIDLSTTFRGPNWSWRIPTLPALPKPVLDSLQQNTPDLAAQYERTTSRSTLSQPLSSSPTKREVAARALRDLAVCYVVLDLLKTHMTHDLYFWGIWSTPSPSTSSEAIYAFIRQPFPSSSHFQSISSPILIQALRLLITQNMIQALLVSTYSLTTLLYILILPLLAPPSFPRTRHAAWAHAPMYGPYSAVWKRGIAGWWGLWWHQTFRFGFSGPSTLALRILHSSSRSRQGKAISSFSAFALSGLLHAAGSWTMLNPVYRHHVHLHVEGDQNLSQAHLKTPQNSYPHHRHWPHIFTHGPIPFFLLQFVGILLETLLSPLLSKHLSHHHHKIHIPRSVIHIFKYTYTQLWFLLTAPLLSDDIARGGVWLFEPVPFSLFRGVLAWGAHGENKIWCWGGEWVRWVSGPRRSWWESGLVI